MLLPAHYDLEFIDKSILSKKIIFLYIFNKKVTILNRDIHPSDPDEICVQVNQKHLSHIKLLHNSFLPKIEVYNTHFLDISVSVISWQESHASYLYSLWTGYQDPSLSKTFNHKYNKNMTNKGVYGTNYDIFRPL